MGFLELAADRYSVRFFSDRPIEPEKMEKILEAGQLAPTAVNFQLQKIYVLKSRGFMPSDYTEVCIEGGNHALFGDYRKGGYIDMIHREDMLELTRRMTPSRTSITRVAGCYVDREGEFDGSFNTNFLKLSGAEKTKNLKLAKTVPFADTNKNLKKYEFSPESQKLGSMWQLLMAMKECGLKNDALMDTFYDVVMERYQSDSEYAILVFHDRYDIPAKASDKERLWESEEVFEYLICVICPLIGEYESGDPECGFLFPAFTDRSGDLNHVNVFQRDSERPHMELVEKILRAD